MVVRVHEMRYNKLNNYSFKPGALYGCKFLSIRGTLAAGGRDDEEAVAGISVTSGTWMLSWSTRGTLTGVGGDDGGTVTGASIVSGSPETSWFTCVFTRGSS